MTTIDSTVLNERGFINNPDASSLIIIDSGISNYQSLIPDGTQQGVVVLDASQNGVEQITQAIENYSNLGSIQIFSHGEAGVLELGNTVLSNASVNSYQQQLQSWGAALSETGDLLFYGCNLGANDEGLELIQQLARFTDADVAASNDLTGNSAAGGDWELEVATGAIEANTLTFADYGGTLAFSQSDLANSKVADFNGDGKADLIRQEKGSWDDDNLDTAHILLSYGNGFNSVPLPEDMYLQGDHTNLLVGDFNGDGLSDFLRQEKGAYDDDNFGTARLFISHGDGTGFTNILLGEELYFHGDFNELYVGDFNGDGKSDIFRQMKLSWDNQNTSWTGGLFISTGLGFVSHAMPTNLSFQGDYTNIYTGDFNGDGKTDLIRQEKGNFDSDSTNDAHVLYSNGTDFTPVALPTNRKFHGDVANIFVGDFNGDGKDDLIHQQKGILDNVRTNDNATLLTSQGSSFQQQSLLKRFYLQGDYTNLYIGDYNGDGKDDILRQERGAEDNNKSQTATLLLANDRSNSFDKLLLSESLDIGGDRTNLYTADFNGDGKTDVLRQEKGWYGFGDSVAEQLFFNGIGFDKSELPYDAWLNGNNVKLVGNNENARYIEQLNADGLKFDFTYDNSVTEDQKRAFEFAGKLWSDLLGDDATINIHISMVDNSDLPQNTLGGAVPFFLQGTSFTDFREQLKTDKDHHRAKASSNYNDLAAVLSLETGDTYTIATPSEDNQGTVQNFNQVAMTRANAKALGFIDGDDRTLDGTIVMNNLIGTGVGWNYNYFSSEVGTNSIDFTTVAIHEIGHTLGFVSAVDALSADNYQNPQVLNESVTALDLFRYDMQSFFDGSPVRSLRTADSFFSVNGGVTNLMATANGVNNIGGDTGADGYQGSHWKDGCEGGIMSPLLSTNQRRYISEPDLKALDIIGWDRKQTDESWDVMFGEAINNAENIQVINRDVEVSEMLDDWRWAGRRKKTRLGQQGNIAQFLAQEGFFSIGAFRESFDFDSVKTQAENRDKLSTNDVWQELSEITDSLEAYSDRESLYSTDAFTGSNEVAKVELNLDVLTSLEQWLDKQDSDSTANNLHILFQELVRSV